MAAMVDISDYPRIIRAKITRANQNIQEFDLVRRSFVNSHPHTIAFKENLETKKRTYYLATIKDPPDEITTTAVDALHNLRTPLDKIAYALAVRGRGGFKPKGKVYFPIADSPEELKSLLEGKKHPMPQGAIDAIKAAEPCKGGKGHAIWQLNRLDTSDKHAILVAGAYLRGINAFPMMFGLMRKAEARLPAFVDKWPRLYVGETSGPVGLKPGDEVYIDSMDNETHENIDVSIDVAFDYAGVIERKPALKALQDMANLVRSITDSLLPFIEN